MSSLYKKNISQIFGSLILFIKDSSISFMELTPSPLAVCVFKIFEKLDTEYSSNRPKQREYRIDWCYSPCRIFSNVVIISFFFRSVADSDLLELYGIFGDQLRAALDIIDRDKISIYRRVSDSREYIEIAQHQNSIHKLLPQINYCMCAEFRDKVIATGELYTCCHVLAAKLAVLLDKVKIETCNDDAFAFSMQMIRPASITN